MTSRLSSLRHDTDNPSTPVYFSLPLKVKKINPCKLLMSKSVIILATYYIKK